MHALAWWSALVVTVAGELRL